LAEQKRRVPAVRVTDPAEGEDGGITAKLVISRLAAQKLKAAAGDDWPDELAAAVRAALKNAGGSATRIVAHVPEWLVDEFMAYCAERGTTLSAQLRLRVSRYVDSDGDPTDARYRNRTPLPPFAKRDKAHVKFKPVQIFTTPEQAEGFRKFCGDKCMQNDVFVMREMLLLINRANRGREAEGTNKAEGDPVANGAAPGAESGGNGPS